MAISIHAPLAGCDAAGRRPRKLCRNFNPRTPCGVRLYGGGAERSACKFQSTHPLRGATWTKYRKHIRPKFQSTHPLRGATGIGNQRPDRVGISIHAPLAGCDRREHPASPVHGYFNPRTPCGVRPSCRVETCGGFVVISIHAPLAGCDLLNSALMSSFSNFNPRTPCGVRLSCNDTLRSPRIFQSTHPLRGATIHFFGQNGDSFISIHAPLAGCDSIYCVLYRAATPTKGGLF